MRPGRLDRILYVGPPDFAGRMDILRIRTRNMAVEPALDLDTLAALVRSPHLPFHLKCDFTTYDVGMAGTDEWVLGGRNHGYVPGGRIDCHARGYQCNICETSIFLRCAFMLISEICRSRKTHSSPPRKPSSDKSHLRCCESLSAGMTNTASTRWRKSPSAYPARRALLLTDTDDAAPS